MEKEISISMYKKYIYGKIFNFLFFGILIIGSILLIGRFAGLIPKSVEHEINNLMGIVLPPIILISVFVVCIHSNYISTRGRLMNKIENYNNEINLLELYFEKNYKIIPKKEQKKLENLNKKVFCVRKELNLIS
jgi:hypothetical protein